MRKIKLNPFFTESLDCYECHSELHENCSEGLLKNHGSIYIRKCPHFNKTQTPSRFSTNTTTVFTINGDIPLTQMIPVCRKMNFLVHETFHFQLNNIHYTKRKLLLKKIQKKIRGSTSSPVNLYFFQECWRLDNHTHVDFLKKIWKTPVSFVGTQVTPN